MNVLVTGASGYIGGRLVPRLLAAGHHVRCMARDPARLAGRPWPGAEIVAGDAHEPESLDRALAGTDAAYYLIHSLAAGEHGCSGGRGLAVVSRAASRPSELQ